MRLLFNHIYQAAPKFISHICSRRDCGSEWATVMLAHVLSCLPKIVISL